MSKNRKARIPEHPVYRKFLDALHSRSLSLGQTVTQNDLCDLLHVGISPLREGIALLEQEGLIEVRRRIGIQILQPDISFVSGTYQLRQMFEAEGLRRFMDRDHREWAESTSSEHTTLMQEAPRFSDEEFKKRMFDLETRFHGSFIAAFENCQADMAYSRLMDKQQLLPLLKPAIQGVAHSTLAMNEHLQIVEAIRQGDQIAAQKSLEQHLQSSLKRTMMI